LLRSAGRALKLPIRSVDQVQHECRNLRLRCAR
jgi:hypothetical protein